MNQLPNKEETPIAEPAEKDPALEKINEIRWDYDLPELTRADIRDQQRREMDEKYGYDTDS